VTEVGSGRGFFSGLLPVSRHPGRHTPCMSQGQGLRRPALSSARAVLRERRGLKTTVLGVLKSPSQVFRCAQMLMLPVLELRLLWRRRASIVLG